VRCSIASLPIVTVVVSVLIVDNIRRPSTPPRGEENSLCYISPTNSFSVQTARKEAFTSLEASKTIKTKPSTSFKNLDVCPSSTLGFEPCRIKSHRRGFCPMAAKLSFACQQQSIIRRAATPFHAKGRRFCPAISFTSNQCSDSMAPSLGSRRLICFYCGRKSAIRQDGSVREWECGNCEAVNYLDEASGSSQFRQFNAYFVIEWRNHRSTCRYG
jgi:hypothetical protein